MPEHRFPPPGPSADGRLLDQKRGGNRSKKDRPLSRITCLGALVCCLNLGFWAGWPGCRGMGRPAGLMRGNYDRVRNMQCGTRARE